MVPIGDHQIALLEPCLLCWPSFDHIRDQGPLGGGQTRRGGDLRRHVAYADAQPGALHLAVGDQRSATDMAIVLGMAKPMPSKPPDCDAISALTPITSPCKFNKGPPLLPGLIAASVCRKS